MSGHIVTLYETDYLYYQDEDGRLQTYYTVPCGSAGETFTLEQMGALAARHNETRLARKEHQRAFQVKSTFDVAPASPAVTHQQPE